jgi:hypothetical protein
MDLLDGLVSSRTKILLVAHIFGARFDMKPWVLAARRHGLLLVEDCAESFEGPKAYCKRHITVEFVDSYFEKKRVIPSLIFRCFLLEQSRRVQLLVVGFPLCVTLLFLMKCDLCMLRILLVPVFSLRSVS